VIVATKLHQEVHLLQGVQVERTSLCIRAREEVIPGECGKRKYTPPSYTIPTNGEIVILLADGVRYFLSDYNACIIQS